MKLIQIFKRSLCTDYIMIDDSDYDKCCQHRWHFNKNRVKNSTGILLHHILFPLVNHDLKYTLTFLDDNPLNYQKENIAFSHRKVIKSENNDILLP